MDASLDSIIQRVKDIKNSIESLIMKLEQEYLTINWPTVLDNFALLSGEVNSLNRVLKGTKLPQLRNCAIIPLHLSPDYDPDLQNMTEGRVSVFNHEVAPIYLRTRPIPEVEDKLGTLQTKAGSVSHDNLQKQINMMNKLLNMVHDTIKQHRESADDLGQKSAIPQLSSQADTNALISAIAFGKGLKSQSPNTSSSSHSSIQDQRIAMPSTPQGMQSNKPPSTVRTNIKAATHIHPYAR